MNIRTYIDYLIKSEGMTPHAAEERAARVYPNQSAEESREREAKRELLPNVALANDRMQYVVTDGNRMAMFGSPIEHRIFS
jgi:hypothetical protein